MCVSVCVRVCVCFHECLCVFISQFTGHIIAFDTCRAHSPAPSSLCLQESAAALCGGLVGGAVHQ